MHFASRRNDKVKTVKQNQHVVTSTCVMSNIMPDIQLNRKLLVYENSFTFYEVLLKNAITYNQ